MGAAHLAGEMYDRIVRNMGEARDQEVRLMTTAAALVHDIGHGPFSHTFEDILKQAGIPFDHERMSRRIIEEDGSEVCRVLRMVDATLPAEIVKYIDKTTRIGADHWRYKLVSSQLDADRLDYLLRDAYQAGLQGSGFDLPRLLDMLLHVDSTRIGVDGRAVEAVEGYLLALDQMYRAIYFHHTARAATNLLTSVLRRAISLYKDGADISVPTGHPLAELIDHGREVPLAAYGRLGEYQIWTLIEEWQRHPDETLSDLASRLLRRHLPKCIELPELSLAENMKAVEIARRLTCEMLPHVDNQTVDLYVMIDEAKRASYKRYDWRRDDADESIFLVDSSGKATAIENERRTIINFLKSEIYKNRLVVPAEIRPRLLAEAFN